MDSLIKEKIDGYQKEFINVTCNYSKVDILNDLSDIYENHHKYNLAYLCLVESLRINACQDGVARKLHELKPKYCLPRLHHYKNDRCMVSVIVPTYNRPYELEECLISIMNQKYVDYEVIVVNDCGTNDAERVVKLFKSNKILYHKLANNKGLPSVRNEAIKLAGGKYIAYLDDDDYYYDNHLKVLVDVLEKSINYDVAYSNAWWVYGDIIDNKFVAEHKKLYVVRPDTDFDRNKLSNGNYIAPVNMFHKRSCLKRTALFNEELPKLEDWDFLLRLGADHKFYQLNDITGEYRWKSNNMSVTGKHEMIFWHELLSTYYALDEGFGVLAKHYYYKKDANYVIKYCECFEKRYMSQYINSKFFKEMLDILLQFGSKTLINRVIVDYFNYNARDCLKKIVDCRSLDMALSVAPHLPNRALRSMLNRIHLKL
jgi:glycosyltransferase involved in cell wall biosynthesis